jgi:hypothetical protein
MSLKKRAGFGAVSGFVILWYGSAPLAGGGAHSLPVEGGGPIPTRGHALWNSSYLYTYDLYSPLHNVLDVCLSITRASGRGLDLGKREFFGPC